MRCIAILVDIDTNIDAVILWANADGTLIAYAYVEGRVTMTRPLAADTFDDCVAEIREVWNITFARVTRIQEWVQLL